VNSSKIARSLGDPVSALKGSVNFLKAFLSTDATGGVCADYNRLVAICPFCKRLDMHVQFQAKCTHCGNGYF
jgi:hypothetical protein